MLQQLKLGRKVLLRNFHVQESAWNLRQKRNELAFAFGMAKPTLINTYGEIDLLSIGLSMLISHHAKFNLRGASAIVRTYWLEWLSGVATAEWFPAKSFTEGPNFVVASDDAKTKFLVEVGPWAQCVATLNKADPSLVPFAVPLSLLIMRVRKGAEDIRLKLPETFCPGPPQSTAFKEWLDEIEAYRKLALKPCETLETAG